jgi:hypothetical protein
LFTRKARLEHEVIDRVGAATATTAQSCQSSRCS